MKKNTFLIIVILILLLVIAFLYFNDKKINPAPTGPIVPPITNEEPTSTPEVKETTTVKIFFGNTVFDPGVMECNIVYPVERTIEKTPAIGTASINELLKGPTAEEKNAGYFTSLNENITLKKLTIEDGTALADFDEQLEYQVGGSCRVIAIYAQIAETLKQFPTVQKVIISVNGRTEDILQP